MKKEIGLAWLALMLMTTISCGSDVNHWSEQRGLVLDEASDEPIEGAHVAVFWVGYAPYTSRVCFHVEAAVTDAEGYFTIPAWTNQGKWRTAEDQHVSISVYRQGYNESGKTYGREQTYKDGKYYLKKSDNQGSGRVEELLYYTNRTCPDSGQSEDKLLEIYEAVYSEADRLASKPEDKLVVITLQRLIDDINLGSEAAWKNWRKAKKEFGL